MKFAALVLLAALALGACSLAGDMTPPPALATAQAQGLGFPPTRPPASLPGRAPDLAAGQAIYQERCSPCHGEAGDGEGVQADQLPNPPTAFTDLQVAQRAVPEAWFEVVTEGRFDRFMPGFSSLTDDQRWDVVGYALSLSLASASIEAGREVFADNCAGCHGPDGRGGDGRAVDLSSPDFQASQSWLGLYGDITQGVGSQMPGFSDSLSDDERWAAAAYVRTLGLGETPMLIVAGATVQPTVAATPALPTSEGTQVPAETPTPTPDVAAAIVGCQVENGTAGAAIPAGLEITLRGFDDGIEVLTRTSAADREGRCRFAGLEPAPGRRYVLTATYQDVVYASPIVEIPADSPLLELPLRIYETTPSADAVRVSRLHLLFDFPAEGLAQVVELWLLSNLGDRTVYPGDAGGLEVSLPEGAVGLSLDGGAVGERFEQTAAGFRDRQPLLPGENTGELVFSYNLSYSRRLQFERPVSVPVDAVVGLVPEPGPAIRADGIEDLGVRDVSGSAVHSYAFPAVPAGGSVVLTLQGSPGGSSGLPSDWTPIVLGATGLALAALAAGLLLWKRESPKPQPAEGAASENAILWAIASLDNDHAAGKIGDDEYQRRRADLIRRAGEGPLP